MEIYTLKNLSFTYPDSQSKALCNINLSINHGDFICLCGKSGCGKTSLLRLLKSALSPFGASDGEILFCKKLLSEVTNREQASKIGFVMQNPDNQIVTDKVWHELAFGLESLGYKTNEIRTRVAEMAAFFGISEWFHKKTTELSGGQKQILNLASVMVMRPQVLILDEPTSQLDPIAASEFIKAVEKINRELGTTVILSEHRLEEAFPIANRIIVMDTGRIIADGNANEVAKKLKEKNHDMCLALPTPMRVFSSLEYDSIYPVTVRDGRIALEKYASDNKINADLAFEETASPCGDVCVELKDVWFRYEKDLPDIIKGLSLKINRGEIFSILGGNGLGKTTALSLISGVNTPYRGKVFINGTEPSEVHNLYDGVLGVLPQNPETLFVKKTVYLDLAMMISDKKISKQEKEARILNVASLCRIDNLLQMHPYDLSGGERQRTALAKILLLSPKILLLDEPTKGFDAHFKRIFADILNSLKSSGITIIMVSHDTEFCAEFSDRCAMFFDGSIISVQTPRKFFSGNNFYTTSASRMARTTIPNAVLADDIILACGGSIRNNKTCIPIKHILQKTEQPQQLSPKTKSKNTVTGIIFAALVIVLCVIQVFEITDIDTDWLQIISAISLAGVFINLLPHKDSEIITQTPKSNRKLSKRTIISSLFSLIAIPVTMFIGIYYLGDRKYYFISLLIILELMLPFFMMFEGKKPQARELVIISALCAMAVAGRIFLFMLPQFKPTLALIIISGVCFGGETGFLIGAVTAFVSNFFFGQGPWTTWQMLGLGMVGFVSGILFRKGFIRKTRLSLAVFGFLATLIIHGGIVNPSSVFMSQSTPTFEAIFTSYALGFPFDLVHAASSAFFLWFISEPIIEKLERIKTKYGLMR